MKKALPLLLAWFPIVGCNFTGFGIPSLDGDRIVFHGSAYPSLGSLTPAPLRKNGNDAIFIASGGCLGPVANNWNTQIPGGTGTFSTFGTWQFYKYPFFYAFNPISFYQGPAVDAGEFAFKYTDLPQEGLYLFSETSSRVVADRNTAIPGGTGNFTGFIGPSVNAGDVAFAGLGVTNPPSGSASVGIYLYDGITLHPVVDRNTPIPGGTGNFTSFGSVFGPALDAGNVAFVARGSNTNGIYLYDGIKLQVVVDTNTPIPGGTGNFIYADFLSLDAGSVAFRGGVSDASGIYLYDGATLQLVADASTPIPGGTGTQTVFVGPSLKAGHVAFEARGSDIDGIYLYDGSTIHLVADTNTPIPGGTGNFTAFGLPYLDGGTVLFYGSGSDVSGLYLYDGITFHVVVDTNTPIPGGTGNFTSFDGRSHDADRVAFRGSGSNIIGIYLYDGGAIHVVADTNTPFIQEPCSPNP